MSFALDAFFVTGTQGDAALSIHHQPGLVLLSFLVATLASMTALQVAALARQARSPLHRRISIGTGALALGSGIWSMHFIGMLGVQARFAISYDLSLTLISLLPALLAAAIALEVLAAARVGPHQLLLGGTVAGLGIGVMHYAGMAAMRTGPALRFDPSTFAASFGAAIALATLALWVRFDLRRRRWPGPRGAVLLSGLVMGAAISATHYIGMTAARFIGHEETAVAITTDDELVLALFVGMSSMAIGMAVIGGNTLLRYRDAVHQLRSSEARLQAMFDTAVDGILTIDRQGTVRSVNRAASRMLGYEADELIGRNVSMLMPEPYRGQHDGYLKRYDEGGAPRVIGIGREVVARHRDGSQIPVRLAVGQVPHTEQPLYVGFLTDISELKRVQAIREHDASHDALTELPNRRAFFLLLHAALDRRGRGGQSVALLFIDLDGFKAVNDEHGHQAGDAVLVEVANRLRRTVRRADTIARLGGDEFVVVLENLQDPVADVRAIGQDLCTAIATPIDWRGRHLSVGASIGASLCAPQDDCSPDQLISDADRAMYEAKHAGRGQLRFSAASPPAGS